MNFSRWGKMGQNEAKKGQMENEQLAKGTTSGPEAGQ